MTSKTLNKRIVDINDTYTFEPIVTLEMLIECLNLMELQCDIFIRMEQTILGSESKEKC